MRGTIGYNPLDHVRFHGRQPVEQDIIVIASALCPREDHESDPFWPLAAANYLASYIAYVLEAIPEEDQTMTEVIRVFDRACDNQVGKLFDELESENPCSYAVRLRRRASSTCLAERMHASIMGIIAANLLPIGFRGAMTAYESSRRVNFRHLGRKRCALFVTIDDMDASLRPLTSLFVRQAFSTLCDEADRNTPDGRLTVPVRFMLDDFANLNLANFDNVLPVIRSREISCTMCAKPSASLRRATASLRRTRSSATATTSLSWGFGTRRRRATSARARISRRPVCWQRRPIVGGCSSAGMPRPATTPISLSSIRISPSLRRANRAKLTQALRAHARRTLLSRPNGSRR